MMLHLGLQSALAHVADHHEVGAPASDLTALQLGPLLLKGGKRPPPPRFQPY